MMQQYERIKAQHQDSILFFRMGDFYEMFRSDALEASRILSLTLTQRHGIPMCGIPFHASQNYIHRLLSAGRKIAVCEQTSLPGKGKGIVERKVVQVISPGTLVDDAFLQGSEHNFLVSVSFTGDKLGLAFLDLSTGELGTRLLPLDQGREALLGELASRNPKELVVQESLFHQHPELASVLDMNPDLVLNRYPDWNYDLGRTQEQLCRLFGTLGLQAFGLGDHDQALHPVSALLVYAQDAARHSLDHVRGIRLIKQGDTMVLDESSIRNLELVRNLRDGSRALTLLSVMDQTQTPMGARLLRQWILEPCRRLEDINERLDAVESLYRNQDLLANLRRHFARLHDIERLCTRVSLEKAGPKDCAALCGSLLEVQEIARLSASAFGPGIWDQDDLAKAGDMANLIQAVIVDEPPYQTTDGGYIRPGYNERLDHLRNLASDSQSVLDRYLEDERNQLGLPGLKIKQNRIIGYYLELSRTQTTNIPAHFMRKHSTVNSERFTTKRLMELEDAIEHAGDESRTLELEIFMELRASVARVCSSMVRLARVCARLDVFSSFAWSASLRGYTRPVMREDRMLLVKAGRHPVVEACAEPGTYIPNDLDLAPDHEGGTATMLLTGPNMAGKSTFLRQTALIALMAHTGSFVPAESATVGLVDRIFCRVGSSDNLAGGESTFLVEMHETASILRNASENSLIIMDEVGRGTSTRDGLAIAWAVLEHMVEVLKCRSLFATHFHELTTVKHPAMANFSLKVHEEGEKVIFLKKVIPGAASNSYGIHVARLAGVPEMVNRRAQEVLDWLQRGPLSGTEEPPRELVPVKSSPPGGAGLFTAGEELELLVKGFSVDGSSPLEALQAIAQWQKILGMEPSGSSARRGAKPGARSMR